MGTALAEMGDRGQWLFLALMVHFKERQRVLFGMVLATAINSIVSAVAGFMLGRVMTDYPQLLFLGMALFLAGATMFLPPWRKKTVAPDATGVFRTSFLAFLLLGFGDRSQFIIAANAARDVSFVYSAIGGTIGISLAMLPVFVLRRQFARRFSVHWVRRISGVLLIGAALMLALRALALVE